MVILYLYYTPLLYTKLDRGTTEKNIGNNAYCYMKNNLRKNDVIFKFYLILYF